MDKRPSMDATSTKLYLGMYPAGDNTERKTVRDELKERIAEDGAGNIEDYHLCENSAPIVFTEDKQYKIAFDSGMCADIEIGRWKHVACRTVERVDALVLKDGRRFQDLDWNHSRLLFNCTIIRQHIAVKPGHSDLPSNLEDWTEADVQAFFSAYGSGTQQKAATELDGCTGSMVADHENLLECLVQAGLKKFVAGGIICDLQQYAARSEYKFGIELKAFDACAQDASSMPALAMPRYSSTALHHPTCECGECQTAQADADEPSERSRKDMQIILQAVKQLTEMQQQGHSIECCHFFLGHFQTNGSQQIGRMYNHLKGWGYRSWRDADQDRRNAHEMIKSV